MKAPIHIRLQLAALPILLCACVAAVAASVRVTVTDSAGQPVPDTVVYAERLLTRTAPKRLPAVTIEQKQHAFVPLVTAIQTGTAISFPNNDTVRHHVYSFSPTKIFELKLYSGVPGNPVVFDKPGTVVVGCNIHDEMVAYIHVVDTPYFAKTDAAGQVVLDALPAGAYKLLAWHYNLPPGAPIPQQALTAEGDGTASFQFPFKADAVAH